MSRPTPTLINLPPPPSANDTPSETPGTPNSTTTSLSALSTTAIKDGHRGSTLPHHTHHSHSRSANLEAAAYRISNLAGLSAATQQSPLHSQPTPGGGPSSTTGYFDAAGNPVYRTKISTVGSASATDVEAGSAGGRTTATGITNWEGSSNPSGLGEENTNFRHSIVSGSQGSDFRGDGSDEGGETEGELDKMSTDGFRDLDRHSMSMGGTEPMDEDTAPYDSDDDNRDGMSEEGNASLVGFGEGAGSTVSGPISSYPGALRDGISTQGYRGSTGGNGSSASAMRALNGGSGGSISGAQQTAERVLRERLGEPGEARGVPPLGSPDEQKGALGKFYFEDGDGTSGKGGK